MYEIIEHWNQYKSKKLEKLELELQEMLKENSINKESNVKEFDKWMNELAVKNGSTKY